MTATSVSRSSSPAATLISMRDTAIMPPGIAQNTASSVFTVAKADRPALPTYCRMSPFRMTPRRACQQLLKEPAAPTLKISSASCARIFRRNFIIDLPDRKYCACTNSSSQVESETDRARPSVPIRMTAISR